jgi:hypothetical protein
MLTNFCRAKLSTHGLMVAITVVAFATNHFFSDPQAAAWLRDHWAIKDLLGTAGATLALLGLYRNPTKPMI